MKTRSKVKSVQASGTWNGKDGTLYYRFDYEMEDGTLIQASHKKQEGFSVGAEVDYEVKRNHETYGKSGTVSKPSDYQKKEVDWDAREKKIAIGHAINNAVQICINKFPGEGIPYDQIKSEAVRILQISEELNNEVS